MRIKKLPKDLRPFLDDDDGFIRWCYENPDGFFYNCYRKAEDIEPYMLHSAVVGGKLCQHFRNKNRPSGFEQNLTTNSFCKVCSRHRHALENGRKVRDCPSRTVPTA